MKKLETNSEYHANEAVGSTLLKAIVKKSVVHALTEKIEKSDSMLMGSALHTLILDPERFSQEFLVAPKVDKRTKAGKEEWAKFLEKAEGKEVINEEQLETVNGMSRSVLSHKESKKWLSGGEAEFSYYAQCPETGIQLKCKPDFVNQGSLIDLKSTRDASIQGFSKACANLMYPVQAAFYFDVYQLATGIQPDDFRFIAVESAAPFGVATYVLDSRDLDFGRSLYKSALKQLKKYLDEKPDSIHAFVYGEETRNLSLPTWAYGA